MDNIKKDNLTDLLSVISMSDIALNDPQPQTPQP